MGKPKKAVAGMPAVVISISSCLVWTAMPPEGPARESVRRGDPLTGREPSRPVNAMKEGA
jgi:hypothetical protein